MRKFLFLFAIATFAAAFSLQSQSTVSLLENINVNEALHNEFVLMNPESKKLDLLLRGNSRANLELQFDLECPNGVGLSAAVGISSDGEHFYITRYYNAQFKKVALDGTDLGNFIPAGFTDNMGLTTLVYDGRYFWGGRMNSSTVYKFDMQANPPACIGSIQLPTDLGFEIVHFTYDSEADGGNGGLWVGGWATDFVLVSFEGEEIRRIPVSTHGLQGISATALDRVSGDVPYLWAIRNEQGNILYQIDLNTGLPTDLSFNLYEEGHVESPSHYAGGMFVMQDLIPGTTSLVIYIQNRKILGFDVQSLGTGAYDIGVSLLDMPAYIPDTEDYEVSVVVSNYGTETVTSFHLNYRINDEEIQTYEVTDVYLEPGDELPLIHPIPFTPVQGDHVIVVCTSLPNGVPDQIPNNDCKTLAFNVYDGIYYKPRTILIESFTSSTCPPCLGANIILHNTLDKNKGKYALIKYQMNWPGFGDPYFTAEGAVRRYHYNINSVPHTHVEGSAWNDHTNGVVNSVLKPFQELPANMELDVAYNVFGNTVMAKATVHSTFDRPSSENLKLYIAVVEKITYNNWGTNGETEFEQVMKKFLPNADGINLGALTAFAPVEIEQEWEFKGEYRLPNNALTPINHDIEHSIENFGNLTVIAWIQNSEKEIVQACNGIEIPNPVFTVSGKITGNNAPEGLAGVEIKLIGKGIFTAVTDANGNYSIPDVYAGFTYTVEASLAGYTLNASTVSVTDDNVTHNIMLVELLIPVVNPFAEEVGDNVVISWDEPGTITPISEWIKHCVNDNVIGQLGWSETAGNDMTAAIRFTPTDLENLGVLSGHAISKFALGVGINMDKVNSMEIRIWEGGTSVTNAGTLVYTQSVTNFTSFTENAMNEVELATPFIIDASKELRIGYRLVNSAGFPIGGDAGPAVAGKGTLFQCPDVSGGSWVEANTVLSNWNRNFSIKAFVTNESKSIVNLLAHNNDDKSKSIAGYVVYRLKQGQPEENWTLLSNSVLELTYTDNDWSSLPFGLYQWAIKAKYEGGFLSDAKLTNPIDNTVGIDFNDFTNLTLYPNPFINEINISNPGIVKSVRVTNVMGQTIKSAIFTGNSISTKTLSSGIYFIAIESFTGEKTVYKMIKR